MRQACCGLPMSVPVLHAPPCAWHSRVGRLLLRVLRGQAFEKTRPSVGLGNHPLWSACGEGLAPSASPVLSLLAPTVSEGSVCGDGPRLLLQLWNAQNNAILSWACPVEPTLKLVYMLRVHMDSVVGVAASREGGRETESERWWHGLGWKRAFFWAALAQPSLTGQGNPALY